MDGDCADIRKICNLKDEYKFNLMVDEAHSYGVYGYGIAYNEKLVDKIDFSYSIGESRCLCWSLCYL